MKRFVTSLVLALTLATSAVHGQPAPGPTGSNAATSGTSGSSLAAPSGASSSGAPSGASSTSAPAPVGPARSDAPNPHGPGGLSTFAFSNPASQPKGDATLAGRVVFKSGGEAVLSGVDIRLFAFAKTNDQSQRVGEWRTETADDGSFQFTGLSGEPSLKYIASALFQGVVYLAEGTSFKEDSKRLELEVPVYTSAAAPGPLTIESMHIILQPEQGGGLQITEVTSLTNPGNSTLVGGKEDTLTLRLDIPQGAKDFQVLQGLLPAQVFLQENALAYTGPIYPGSNQIVIGYVVPPQESWMFRRRVPVSTGVVDVFVPQGGPAVLSPQLERKEPINLQGANFDRYSSATLDAGSGISFQIGGTANGDSSRSSLPAAPIATVVGLALAAFVFWPLFAKRGAVRVRRDAGEREHRIVELVRERDKQMDFVREVDFDFESGKLAAEDHQKLREEHKTRAIRAMQALAADGVPEDVQLGEQLADVLAGRVSPPRPVDATRSVTEPGQPGAASSPLVLLGSDGAGRPRPPVAQMGEGEASSAAGPLKFCTECGAPTQPEDKFCGVCGNRLRVVNG